MAVIVTPQAPTFNRVTLGDLAADLRVAMQSPAGSGSRLTDQQIGLVIRRALEELSSMVWIEGQLSVTPDPADRVIVLPEYAERIVRIEWIDTTGQPITIQSYRRTGRTIRLAERLSPLGTLQITYLRKLPVPPETQTLSTSITATDTSIPIPSPHLYPVPGQVKIDNEVIDYTDHSATALTGVTRGSSGTTAMTHSSGADVAYVIPLDRRVHHVVLLGAEMYAWKLRIANGPQAEISLALTNLNTVQKLYHEARKTLAGPLPSTSVSFQYRTPRRPLLT